jgi:hypothetical protein
MLSGTFQCIYRYIYINVFVFNADHILVVYVIFCLMWLLDRGN